LDLLSPRIAITCDRAPHYPVATRQRLVERFSVSPGERLTRLQYQQQICRRGVQAVPQRSRNRHLDAWPFNWLFAADRDQSAAHLAHRSFLNRFLPEHRLVVTPLRPGFQQLILYGREQRAVGGPEPAIGINVAVLLVARRSPCLIEAPLVLNS